MANLKQKWSKKRCMPCEGGVRPFEEGEAKEHLKSIAGWKLAVHRKSIQREYVMKDFLAAIDLIRAVAKLAEDENHHPDIHLTSYRKLQIELSTHAIGGLSENDFIMAAKIEELPKLLK